MTLLGDFERQDRRDRIAVVTQRLVGRILDDSDVEIFCKCQDLLAAVEIDGLAGRIGEVGGKIGELYLAAGSGSGRAVGPGVRLPFGVSWS